MKSDRILGIILVILSLIIFITFLYIVGGMPAILTLLGIIAVLSFVIMFVIGITLIVFPKR